MTALDTNITLKLSSDEFQVLKNAILKYDYCDPDFDKNYMMISISFGIIKRMLSRIPLKKVNTIKLSLAEMACIRAMFYKKNISLGDPYKQVVLESIASQIDQKLI